MAFNSDDSNLVTGDGNGAHDVFVHDRTTGTTERVSVDSGGTQGNSHSFGATISADGRYVAFNSYANNLVSGDGNGTTDIFVRDRGPQNLLVFSGFNSPVDNLPVTNSAKAGSSIPIKWQLTDENGDYVSDLSVVESLQFAPVNCDSMDLDLVDPIEAFAAGASGLQYDATTNEFQLNWESPKNLAQTCAVFALTLTDGQQQFARFWLK